MLGHAAQPAFAGEGGVVTYGELHELVGKARAALAQLRLDRPTTFGLVGDHGAASAAWLLALAEAGHHVAPLSGNVAEHPSKLAVIHAQWVVVAEPSAWRLLPRVDEPSEHLLFRRLRERGTPGLILFSSGTSGAPKAIVHDFGQFLAAYRSRHASHLPMLALLGFDHIGGLNTLFSCLAAGALLVVPASRDPAVVATAIARHQVAVLPASPTFLNLLLAAGVDADLGSLRVITFGTEPMPETLLARLKAAFPRVRFIQTFGTTETGIARTESAESGPTFLRFEDPRLEWKVVDRELWLRSGTQAMGYLNADDARFTADGWFRTGDLVEQGAAGGLRIVGRIGETINVGGEKLLPAEVEAVILSVPGVLDCRVLGEPSFLTGQSVTADVVAAPDADLEALRSAVRGTCRLRLAPHKVPARVRFVASVSGERLKKVRPASAR
jgi:acyl-coenzyme A synthetase/AMP-(fatty) acid ligase